MKPFILSEQELKVLKVNLDSFMDWATKNPKHALEIYDQDFLETTYKLYDRLNTELIRLKNEAKRTARQEQANR